jgi:branched-chain amino acid transport system substrate-binding protein
MSTFWHRRTAAVSAVCISLTIACAACGGGGTAGEAKGLPSTVTIKELGDISGATAYLGKQADNGAKLAVNEINDSHFLGNTKLELDVTDTASNQQTSASAAAQAAAGKFPVVILNEITNTAAAAVPVLQRQKTPTLAPITGPEATDGNSYVYNLATPVVTLQNLNAAYAQKHGATKLGIIYDSGIATFADIANKVYPEIAGDYGLDVVETAAITSSTVDVSAPVNKVVGSGADAIFIGTLGAQAVSIIQEARRDGFTGMFLSTAGVSGGALAPAGKDAVGVTWSNEYSAASPMATEFAKKYAAAFGGEVGIQVAANSYDAVWLAARAIKEADTTDRAAVADALKKVTSAPMQNSPRGKVTFKGNQAYATGVLLQWDGSKEILVPTN